MADVRPTAKILCCIDLTLKHFIVDVDLVHYQALNITQVKISDFSIEALVTSVTGEEDDSIYASGPELVKFFNSFGLRDVYDRTGGGLPGSVSRSEYARNGLRSLNGKQEFRGLVEALADSRRVSDADSAATRINEIVKHDGYALEKSDDGIYKVAGAELATPVQVKAHFSEIKKEIISHIKNAEFCIWVAVAWFTDKEIGNELLIAKGRGVNIQVIVNDDEITRKHGLDFDSKGIEYYKVSSDSRWGKKLMHNKYCVIDLTRTIHGSFNWTGNASYNDEGVTTTVSRDIAEDFSRQFMQLKMRQ